MKKFVLFALLAGSMLASCASQAKVAVNQEKDLLAGITEDTFAHEDLFSTVAFNGPKKVDGMLDGTPIIGIQHKLYTNALDQDVMAIRFVAAINAPDLAGTTATWTRHIYDGSGNETKDETTSFTVTKAYTTLNAGEGAALNIASFAGYTNFVVYTIGNIPTSGVNNYYITASLALGGAASGESKVLATTIDQSTQFTFANTDTGYFGVKMSAETGAFTSFDCAAAPGDGNLAKIEAGSFAKDDSFLIVNRGASFKVYGYSALVSGAGNACFGQRGSSQLMSAKVVSDYHFYLTNSFGIWPSAQSASITMTLYLEPGGYWNYDGARFAVYTSAEEWYSMSEIGSSGIFSATVTFNPKSWLIFARMNGAALENTWSNKWAQIQNNSDFACRNKFIITRNNGDYSEGYWATY